jgi:hypothetical protein
LVARNQNYFLTPAVNPIKFASKRAQKGEEERPAKIDEAHLPLRWTATATNW